MRLLFLIFSFFYLVNAKEPKVEYDGKALNVPLNADGTVELLQHWTDQAFSGLLAAVAEKKKKSLGVDFHDDFELCSKKAVSINKHAKCVSKLLKNEYVKKAATSKQAAIIAGSSFRQLKDDVSQRPLSRPMTRFEKLRARNMKLANRYFDVTRINRGNGDPNQLQGKRRTRFSKLRINRIRRDTSTIGKPIKVVTRDSYSLHGSEGGMTPFGMVAKMLTKQVLAVKNKTELTNWKAAVQHVRQAAKEKRDFELEQNKRAKDEESDDIERFAFRGLKHEGFDIDIEKVLNDPKELRKMAKENRQKKMNDPMGKVLDLLRQGVKLGYSATGQNTTNFDDKTLKVASPRFLSLLPEDDAQTANLLSPSLFSLHNEGRGVENLTSLPSLIKGFNSADQQSWLNLIIEAAGVEDQAQKLDKELYNDKHERFEEKKGRSYEERNRAKDGTPLYFTKENVTTMYGDYETRKIQTFEKLLKTYTKEQMREMNQTGYAVLTPAQLHLLYGPQSPYNSSEALERLLSVNATSEDMHEYIERDIHVMAEMKSFKLRQKDIVLSPVINSPFVAAFPAMNQPIVLSPVVFSPVILTPSVLGPFILSPWVFVPVILSPRVLSPLIVNPLIFSPIVLSPLVLHPMILTPGVFNPVVLSPLVLSPFILSPQVFTPIILSPLVLNPLILTPMVGSPLVLSPFVLSPLILSPQALFAVVLSPYTLSPLVLSPLIAAEVILSPSSLS